jgi:toxin CptA
MIAARPFTVLLTPSRRLALALAFGHAAGAGALAAADVPPGLALAIAAALLGHATGVILRVALLRGRDAIVALQAGRPDALPFQTRDGAWHEGRLLGSTYVAPFLTVINLEVPGRRRARHVVILPDAADPEAFRRLRVWLRWGLNAASRRY